ncbi:uncharacterized protein K441DRAFT_331977 [Cenococcum geophilum 1.58]|uniref:Uncharacterized protein n=1 Tax=Cenococcum geophilum 1.58 TaxID=794803 RepID=A0ACC8ENS5_9PEZI|nr:hypothetical protein K441DRAFT_331977 [Cenococcum geophilum 1.58]
MATPEQPSMPVNGNYAPHQAQTYGSMDSNYNAANANSASYGAAPSNTSSHAASGNGGAPEIPKDEVGWYFVEQYYTTLSRSPEKLYLFYNKRSQFVSGLEEEKLTVCIGQRAINDRIKELDFHDCKVRVTNVDSQGSDQNIVIQVIGEISNKGEPHKKFVQTFVLAEQTNGYFVLNDIFRYIADEPELEEEQLQQDPSTVPAGVQEPATTSDEPEGEILKDSSEIPTEEDIAEVDHKLEEVARQDESTAREASPPPAEVNGTPVSEAAEVADVDEAPAAAVSMTEETPSKEADEPVVEEPAEVEKPKDAAPTPPVMAPKPAATPTATTPAPPKPAAPRTWASLAASANRVATPAVPAPTTASTPAQPKVSPAAQTQSFAPPAPAASSSTREPSPANSQGDSTGWQTAGHEHKQRQSRSQNQTPAGEVQNMRAYIKNVYDSVDADALKAALAKHGEIAYFDVSRQKNCAFVDFATPAAFQAAVNANPHKVGDDNIYVEERRLRSNQFPFQRGGMRGRGQDRPGGPGRGGFKNEGGRGGFVPRGRGGNVTPRARGGPQAA